LYNIHLGKLVPASEKCAARLFNQNLSEGNYKTNLNRKSTANCIIAVCLMRFGPSENREDREKHVFAPLDVTREKVFPKKLVAIITHTHTHLFRHSVDFSIQHVGVRAHSVAVYLLCFP
jgi:hypothetical protein